MYCQSRLSKHILTESKEQSKCFEMSQHFLYLAQVSASFMFLLNVFKG